MKKIYRTSFFENDKPVVLLAKIRFDDECKKGHKTFSVTGERYETYRQRGEPTIKHDNGDTLWLNSCGCLHDDIVQHFPDLAEAVKYHLVSEDGPMHYVANSLYWKGEKHLEHFRATAVWPDATLADMENCTATVLQSRLYAVMSGFNAMLERFGMIEHAIA